MLQQFDMVRLVRGVPEVGLPPGTVAVILEVSDVPDPHYEIEVADGDGRTLYQGSATPDEVEPA
jgi:Domain of unknown function (DUF4926)